MRILMISDVYFPRVNGVSTSIQTFRDEFIQLGHDVSLIAPDYGIDVPNNDEWVLRIPARKVLMDPEDRMMKRGYILRLVEQLKAQRFDIVHIHTPFIAHYAGCFLAKKLHIPCVVSYHTFFEEYLYHYVPYAPASLMRMIARRFSVAQCHSVDAVIVPSQAMLTALRNYGTKSEIRVIPTGITHERFNAGNRDRFRSAHSITEGRSVLVYVGRVAFEKNIGFLLNVLANLQSSIPDILLLIAGEGPAVKDLQQQSINLNIVDNVKFIGYLDRETLLSDCYSAGDIFVFASKTETQGLVLIEAMAQGVPVVSLAAMGSIDILAAEKGALIAKEDIKDFTDKLIRVLSNKQLMYKMSEEGKEYAAQWNSRTLAESMLEYYRHIISSASV